MAIFHQNNSFVALNVFLSEISIRVANTEYLLSTLHG